MTTKVFKYGAFPPPKESSIRQQMKLARNYYNSLVEAENARRKKMWDGESPPKPPHDHDNGDSRKCDECRIFWKGLRDQYREFPLLDLKPIRSKASENGLYWGSYLIVEQAFAAAWKKTDVFSLVKYRSWKQGGYAGVQVQQAKRADSFFRIEHREDPRTGKKRRGTRYKISIRIGTNKKQLIWSDPINFIMHRPLQGRPTWAEICMHYRGEKEIWSINIICADVPERLDKANNGVVAIDVGWRVLEDDHLRIAFATGVDEKEEEFKLGPEWRELSNRADRIRSHRDNRLDVLKIAIPKLSIIKKPSSVKSFLEKNEMMTDDLTVWCKKDRHLAQYEIGCRRRSEDKRRNDMRVWLRELRRKYKFVVIKNSSHKEMKDHKTAIESGMLPPQRRNAHHAAPGEVIEEICKVWDRKTEVSIIDANGTNTTTCPECNSKMEPPDNHLWAVCERCGAREDRDRISTRNLLLLYAKGEYKKPTARKTTARFAKRHKNSSGLPECPPIGL